MRWMIFKVIAYVACFIFMQGAILPWAISNNSVPLWADIIIVTAILMMWLAVIDRLACHVLKLMRRHDEVTNSN